MPRSISRLFALSSLMLACVACGSSPEAASTVDLGPIPSAETLCKITPHTSTAVDVRTILGPPGMTETFSDGSSTSLYDYDAHTSPNRTVAILQVWFTSAQLFSTATVSNMDMPACWHFDFDAGL